MCLQTLKANHNRRSHEGRIKVWSMEPPITNLRSDRIGGLEAIVIGGYMYTYMWISVNGQCDRQLIGSAVGLS